MKKILIAGGSGLVGRELCALLLMLDYEVLVLTRGSEAPPGTRAVRWDAGGPGPWTAELEGAVAVINLVGSPISVKWTKESKAEILESRLRSTQAIAKALAEAKDGPSVWINASAIGYYGDRGATELDEAAGPGPRRDFLVDTCVAWEHAVDEAKLNDVRKVKLRLGVVLAKAGGILPPLLKLTRCFVGGQIASGEQYISWVHAKDVARAIVFLLEHEISGAVNVTSPNPSSNRFFMAALRSMVGRPWCPPVPAFALRVANWFGAPDPSLLLTSHRAIPAALQATGFTFEFDHLRDAVRDLM